MTPSDKSCSGDRVSMPSSRQLPVGAQLRVPLRTPPDQAGAYLRRWQRGAVRARAGPILDFGRMVGEYWLAIVRWHHSKVSNGLLEGLNSLIQAAKRCARATAPPATTSR